MCGIYFSTKLDIEEKRIQQELSYRGSDHFFSFNSRKLYFSHSLLARTDSIEKSGQPYQYENLTLLFTGEIYNHLKIREQLNHNFETLTDTETLAIGFQKLGPSVFNLIEGMYAVLIYDEETNLLHITRDSFGIKPLYYSLKNQIKFSSSLSLFPNEEKNKTTQKEYLNYGWNFGNTTLLNNVYSFPKGEYWVIDLDTHKTQKSHINRKGKSDKIALKEVIINSFKEQSRTKLKQGILFSGGVDSTVLAILAKELHLEIPLYTFDFKGNQEKYGFSEDLKYAKKIALELQMELKVVSYEKDDFNDYKKQLSNLNEPYLDLAGFSLNQICKQAQKDEIKILHSGLGPDEFWGGYRRHRIADRVKTNFILKRSAWLQRVVINFILSRRLSLVGIKATHFNGRSFLDKTLNLDREDYLTNNNIKYAEAIGLNHDIETRFPFLTEELSRFFNKEKQDVWFKKIGLLEILKDYLPDEMINRPKSGFALPSRSLKINVQEFRKDILNTWFNKIGG